MACGRGSFPQSRPRPASGWTHASNAEALRRRKPCWGVDTGGYGVCLTRAGVQNENSRYHGSEFPPSERIEKVAASLARAGHEIFLLCNNDGRFAESQETAGVVRLWRLRPTLPCRTLNRAIKLPVFFNPLWALPLRSLAVRPPGRRRIFSAFGADRRRQCIHPCNRRHASREWPESHNELPSAHSQGFKRVRNQVPCLSSGKTRRVPASGHAYARWPRWIA